MRLHRAHLHGGCGAERLTLSAIFVGLGNISLGAFTTEAGALGYGTIRMWHVELLECMTSTYEVTAGAMRGMGWSVLPTIVVIVGSCLLRIAFIFWVFPSMNDHTSLMNIYPITWIVTGTTMIALFFFARHRAYAGVRQAQAQAAKHHKIAEI